MAQHPPGLGSKNEQRANEWKKRTNEGTNTWIHVFSEVLSLRSPVAEGPTQEPVTSPPGGHTAQPWPWSAWPEMAPVVPSFPVLIVWNDGVRVCVFRIVGRAGWAVPAFLQLYPPEWCGFALDHSEVPLDGFWACKQRFFLRRGSADQRSKAITKLGFFVFIFSNSYYNYQVYLRPHFSFPKSLYSWCLFLLEDTFPCVTLLLGSRGQVPS